MPPVPKGRSAPPCPHELRPGTTVCLRCRREQQQAVRARLGRNLLRAALAVGALAAVVALALTARRPHRPTLLGSAASTQNGVVQAVSSSPESDGQGTVGRGAIDRTPEPGSALGTASSGDVAGTRSAAAPQTAAPGASSVEGTPDATRPSAAGAVLPEGRTEFGDGLFAVRDGRTVTVYFDTPATRTRRRDKFERVLRQTLPRIYGALGDSTVSDAPITDLLGTDDLVTEIAARGLRIPTPDGRTLAIWPGTRPGRDGPLVVSYRVVLK